MIIAGLFAAIVSVGGPQAPSESLARISVPDGFVVDLVASEPLVVDPVAIAFDAKEDLFVVEYRDYPLGSGDPKTPPLSRIKRLHDVDGDGVMDQATVFAEGLPWCQGVMAWEKGVLATVEHSLIYLEDVDGDGRADIRRDELRGLGKANPQLEPAFPTLGRDGWIYLTNGLSGGKVSSPQAPHEVVELGSADLRWLPEAGDIQACNGPGQFGMSFDDWGNRFTCSNRNPIIHDVLSQPRSSAFDLFSTRSTYDVAPSGGASRVYPAIETSTTAFSHTGTHTAACGVLVYRGTGLGPACDGWVFVCDPTGYLVSAHQLHPEGMTFKAERIVREQTPKLDWLTSTDPWFRPVSLANGPDGSLYVVDMYREVIEHPAYMPPGLAEKLNLRAGDDRGRIYRVRRRGINRPVFHSPTTSADQVELLSSPEGWQRDLGFRLLRMRGDEEIVEALKGSLTKSSSPMFRRSAMDLLALIDELDGDLLLRMVQDADAHVRERAWQYAIGCVHGDVERWKDSIQRGIADTDERVRAASVRTVSSLKIEQMVEPILSFVLSEALGTMVWESVRGDLAGLAPRLCERWVRQGEVGAAPATKARLRDLAMLVGARGTLDEVRETLGLLSKDRSSIAISILLGVSEGLHYSSNEVLRVGLSSLCRTPPVGWERVVGLVKPWADRSISVAHDATMSSEIRIDAISLWPILLGDESNSRLVEIARDEANDAVGRQAVALLAKSPGGVSIDAFVDGWSTYSASMKESLLSACWERGDATKSALMAMKRRSIPASLVPVDRRELFLIHSDASIRELSVELFGEAASKDRIGVIASYSPSLSSTGDAKKGEQVFRRVCAACHRVAGEGNRVGPDITDVRNKTPEQLLAEVLDPNRIVEPRYGVSTVLMMDGRSLSGIVVSDNGEQVVLMKSGGTEDRLRRAEIEEIQSSSQSLMPVGLEKEITPAEMNDLIAYLRSNR